MARIFFQVTDLRIGNLPGIYHPNPEENRAAMDKNSQKTTIEKSRKKLLGILIVVAVLPLICMSAFSYYAFAMTRQEENNEFIKSAVEDRHVIIEQFLFERMAMLKGFARTHALDELTDGTKLTGYLMRWQEIYEDYKSLAVFDMEGNQISGVNPDIVGGLDMAVNVKEKEWFAETLASGEHIGSLYLGGAGEPVLSMAVHVKNENDEWIVRTDFSVERLHEILEGLRTSKNGGTYIVDPITGVYLSRPYYGASLLLDKNEFFNTGERHNHVDYDFHGVEEVEVGVYENPAGDTVLEAHCCTRNGRWLVVVERGINQGLFGMADAVGGFLTVFVLSLVMAIAGVFLSVKYLTRIIH